MTFQQHLMEQVGVIDLLLRYLPFCENQEEFDKVMSEIRKLRKEVGEIEEMTKTERQKKVKFKLMTIESEMNNGRLFFQVGHNVPSIAAVAELELHNFKLRTDEQ